MGRDSLITDLGEWSGNETTLATGMSNLHVPCSDLQNGDEFMNRSPGPGRLPTVDDLPRKPWLGSKQ